MVQSKVVLVVFAAKVDPESHKRFLEAYGNAQWRPSRNESGPYAYLTDQDVQKGDRVVVECNPHGLTVATVMDADPLDPPKATKWIVSKLDLDAHNNRIERQKQIAKLERDLKARAEEIKNKRSLEQLLEGDEAGLAMLAELRKLQEA